LTFEPILIKLKSDQVFLHGAVFIDSVDRPTITPGARFLLRSLKDAGTMRSEAEHGNEVRSQPGPVLITKTLEDPRTLRDFIEGSPMKKG
jgi:hypothetical protein